MRSWNNFWISIAAALVLAACGGGQGPDPVARSAPAAEAMGPGVQDMEPAAHSLNVPRTTTLVIKFSKPIIASTVGRQTLKLVGPKGQVAGSFDLSTCGILGPCEFPSGATQQVVFRPSAPLEPSTQYHVDVFGVLSVGGAPVARYRTVFTTAIEHGHDSRLSAGGGNSCVVLEGGQVKCWGINTGGQLGINSSVDHGGSPTHMGSALPAVELGAGRTAVQVAVGDGHSCALLDDASVKCWGTNSHGQLGQGHGAHMGNEHHPMPEVQPVALGLAAGDQVAAIAAGGLRSCALSKLGVLKCWGQNNNVPADSSAGYLGLGDTQHHGDNAQEMGANLPAVNVGTGRRVAQVAMGFWHTCALLDDASLKCWGRNHLGQLGLGDTQDRGATPASMGDGLPAVDLGERRALLVTAGSHRTCALLDDQSVRCWGDNAGGRLGLGVDGDVLAAYGTQPGQMGAALPAIQLGTGLPLAISAGSNHTCARFADASLKCWGINSEGQLGLGDTHARGDAPGDMGQALPAVNLAGGVVSISAGGTFGCARLQNLAVKCWGFNKRGQLGLRDTLPRGKVPEDMGGNLPELSF
jgi:alpha-tubulin suppressor-like RCC1 family protein